MFYQLETIADELGMLWGMGDQDDLNKLTNALNYNLVDQVYSDAQYILFLEGFINARLSEDGQGALEYRHNLSLIVGTSSHANDNIETRRCRTEEINKRVRQVYRAIKTYGIISDARLFSGFVGSDKKMELARLTLTLLPPAVSLCK